MKLNNLYKYKSLPKNTPLAPEWDIELYEFIIL